MTMRAILPLLALLTLGAASPPARVCPGGPYIVFFEWSSSALRKQAVEVLNQAVEASDDCGPTQIMIAGHIDDSEDPIWSRQRLKGVSAYFASRGIFLKRSNIRDFRNTQQRVATAGGIREPQNRRVEIYYKPAGR